MRQIAAAIVGGIFLAANGASQFSSAATLLPPTPYLSAADSPIGTAINEFYYLEDFEDGSLSTSGVTATPLGSIIGPSQFTDSVDSDSGPIDGSGTSGYSLLSGGVTNSFSFQFDAAVLGKFPTRAGIVWTDVGAVSEGAFGVGTVIFEAYGPANESLGTTMAVLGDGAITGGTTEDRFFGAINPDGISRITITMPASTDWEVDHLQYLRVPEPISLAPALAGLVATTCKRRVRARHQAEIR